MRILLINPPRILPYFLGGPYAIQPHGLEYMAAGLMGEHDAVVYDAAAQGLEKGRGIVGENYVGAGFDEIGRRIMSAEPDVVGIAVSSIDNLKSALLVAMTAKSVDRGIVTVLSGPDTTIWPAQAVSHPAVNFVIIDEAERTMQELVRTIGNRDLARLGEIRGIAYKKDGNVVLTAPRPPLMATTAFVGA